MLDLRTAERLDPSRSEEVVVVVDTWAYQNKLASLEATLVRNSAHPLTHLLTHRGKV